MKESIGYTVSLNIMIVFITIVVAFLCAALIYFKSNKASNVITSAIENIKQKIEDVMSLGYTKEEVLNMAKKFSSLKEFNENAPGYYQSGYRSDYWEEIKEICKPLQRIKYTEEELTEDDLAVLKQAKLYELDTCYSNVLLIQSLQFLKG